MRIIIALAMVLIASVANAQSTDTASANFMVPYCKDLLKPDTHAGFPQGLCAGEVTAFAAASPKICAPGEAAVSQMVRVVVAYIEARPARMHEQFLKLAEEALRDAWPCPKR